MNRKLRIQMKTRDEIEATMMNRDELYGNDTCNVDGYDEVICINESMIDAIAGKEIDVFNFPFGIYKYCHWNYTTEGGTPVYEAWYILKEWVESIVKDKHGKRKV